nr:uncharacterized protein LOC109169255 isoform X3 [Ipomoea batatas]
MSVSSRNASHRQSRRQPPATAPQPSATADRTSVSRKSHRQPPPTAPLSVSSRNASHRQPPPVTASRAASQEKSVDQEIVELKVELDKQGIKKTQILSQFDEAIQHESQEEKKNVEQEAMNLLLITAYKKLMATRGGNSSRKAASKVVEGKTKAFANRTLVRYKEYESTGKSCFSEPKLKEILFSPPCKKDMKSALSTFRRNFIGGWRKKATRRKSYPRYKGLFFCFPFFHIVLLQFPFIY